MIQGSWSVEYTDGTTIAQYDATHPAFKPESGEVPYRAIEFARARTITFESQLLGEAHTFTLQHNDGYKITLHSRTFMGLAGGAEQVRCFFVATTPVDQCPCAAHSVAAMFWFPDGSAHHTCEYDSADVRRYGAALAHQLPAMLAQQHDQVHLMTDASVG